MTTLDETRRRVWSVARQLASREVRRAALAQLRPGDVVQATDPETNLALGCRRLTALDHVRATVGVSAAEWPLRYIAELPGLPDWLADDEGAQLAPGGLEHVSGGWVLVRPWLSPAETERLLREAARIPERPASTWELYEQHMADVYQAVLVGADIPEVPWRED
jgi:hypothetical protein